MLRSASSLFGVLACCLAISTEGTASATTIIDGADFSVDLPDTLCFFQPETLRSDRACDGLKVDNAPKMPEQPGVAWLGVAVLRLGSGDMGTVMVVRSPPNDRPFESDEEAERSLKAAAKAYVQDEQIRKVEASGVKRYRTTDGLDMVRGSLDVTEWNVPSASPAELARRSLLQHWAYALVFTETATYHIMATGPRLRQSDVDGVVDDSLSTIRATKPLRGRNSKRALSDLVASGFGIFLAVVFPASLVGTGIWLFRRRRRSA
jgi:hypothetical protein